MRAIQSRSIGLIFGFLFILLGISTAEAHIWDFLRGRNFTLLDGSECGAGVGPCEFEAIKNIDPEMVIEQKTGIPLVLGSKEIPQLAEGKVYVAYDHLSTKDFAETFRSFPNLIYHPVFQGSVVTVLSGVFVTQAKSPEYHHPQAVLSPERMERMVRKLKVNRQTNPFQIEATKTIKFMRWKFSIPLIIEAAWHYQPLDQWYGDERHRLEPFERSALAAPVQSLIPLEQEMTHWVQIISEARDLHLRGAATYLATFLSPDGQHALVCFWQFVAANDLKVLKMLQWIPSVSQKVEEKYKMTALRDFARSVDVIRSPF